MVAHGSGSGGGCCVLQGLFIRRQAHVAAVYARAVAHCIVTPRAVLEELLLDPERLRASTRIHALNAMEYSALVDLASAAPSTASAAPVSASAAAAGAGPVASLGAEAAALPTSKSAAGAAAGGTAAAAVPAAAPSWLLLLQRAVEFGGRVAGARAPSAAWQAARESACEVICRRMPDALNSAEAHLGEAMALEATLRERMSQLPP